MVTPPVTDVSWQKSHRLIRSIYPPVDLFEDIAPPRDWELTASAEAKTNPRLRDEIGDLTLVPAERRVSGPSASWAMAPFTHASRDRLSRRELRRRRSGAELQLTCERPAVLPSRGAPVFRLFAFHRNFARTACQRAPQIQRGEGGKL
ncbi:MAG TPA: hypothetical protein VEI03_21705 [Stellaceae bacterium]|nr:hypothetical protein [Stellaceae bacterium]